MQNIYHLSFDIMSAAEKEKSLQECMYTAVNFVQRPLVKFKLSVKKLIYDTYIEIYQKFT